MREEEQAAFGGVVASLFETLADGRRMAADAGLGATEVEASFEVTRTEDGKRYRLTLVEVVGEIEED